MAEHTPVVFKVLVKAHRARNLSGKDYAMFVAELFSVEEGRETFVTKSIPEKDVSKTLQFLANQGR